VGFKIFKRSLEARLQITQDKRMARVKSLHSLPLGVWAKAVLTSRLFSWLMVSLIVLTAVVQAVQTELSRESYPKLYSALQTADDIATLMFAVEIALKWLDSFQRFWHDRWNVFDLVITALALAPMVLSMTLYGSSWSGARALNGELRVLRSLRVLKLVARMTSLRVVVATIFEALQSLGFILLLLVLLTFLFAVFAMSLFERYTQSERSDLEYQSRFKNLPNTLVTLFQLLTLDQWYIMQRDVERVVHPALTIVFFLFWVWLGGLVFRNVFVGVMGERAPLHASRVLTSAHSRTQTLHSAQVRRDDGRSATAAHRSAPRAAGQARPDHAEQADSRAQRCRPRAAHRRIALGPRQIGSLCRR
jgi:cation channel sperm-associated protein 2